MSTKKLVHKRRKDGMVFIRYEGGGEVPSSLKGLYTRGSIAQAAIDHYNKHVKRGRKSAKGTSAD